MLLPLLGEALEREQLRIEWNPRVGGHGLADDDPGSGGAVLLPVERLRDRAAGPAPELAGRDLDDVGPHRHVGADEITLPVVLRTVAAEEDVLVEAQYQLAVQVVLILRYRLQDPVRPADEDFLNRRPRYAGKA